MTTALAGSTGLDAGPGPAGTSETKPAATAKPPRARQSGAGELVVMLGLSALILGYAWTRRNEGDLSPETGLGYGLGIAGVLAMLTLLLYPLRKRVAKMRVIGNVRNWFRIHMMLGIIGPVLILLHANFTLGSLNSTVALFAMLVVAGSGLVGRLFYSRIHRGLYGRRATVREYLEDIDDLKHAFDDDMSDPSWLLDMLRDFEAERLGDRQGLWPNLRATLSGPLSRYRLRRAVMDRYRAEIATPGARDCDRTRLVRAHLDSYLRTVARAQSFALYERLFALWHLFHLPLFVILVFAVIVHVVGVHLY